MSDYYNEDEIGNIDEEDDIEEVEWTPSDEEIEDLGSEQIPDLVAPTIYPGKENLRTWNPDGAYGIKGTTAEGQLGKKLGRAARITRTPDERFRDNIERVASSANANVDRGTVNSVLKMIPIIPDISYKNPGGCLLGWMFRKYLGRKLTAAEKREADKILSKAESINDKYLQISPLDVVRYARAWNLWIKNENKA